LITLFSCQQAGDKKAEPIFEVLDHDRTGLDFNNKLTPTEAFNVFKYMYFYNGAGVGAGDFNNDGLIDIFFASNQGDNKIYLNTGNLHFKDITRESGIPRDGGWSTGVSLVDINNDGLLDIYVCRVGKHEILNNHNLLLICQGIDANGVPHYEDESREYGLDFSGFSTQAVFFDYDMDGDLDMYLLNHTIHQNGTFGVRSAMLNTFSPLSGDRLYRNDNGHFTDVTDSAGIHHSIIGYGLGISVSDIQLDGYPDIYVGNDFYENDYLYINQHNGKFREELTSHTMHSSRFSMGVDIADVNNDGYPEIISMDMMPADPYILKRSEGEDSYDIYQFKLAYGYSNQYTRNNLQYNRRNGMFSEIGLYSDVYATDWSWSPLWMDFDNDGKKDLFVSNGIPIRLTDIDYINYISNAEIQSKMQAKNLDERNLGLIGKFPQIKIPNKFYRNSGEMRFTDMAGNIGNDQSAYSNGAAYADFDNDGDLDIIVNNIDHSALLYHNTAGPDRTKFHVDIDLKGPPKNLRAIGAKILIYANGGVRIYEKFPVHGFMSSMEIPIHVGLYQTHCDSAFVIWPDNSYVRFSVPSDSVKMSFSYQEGLPKFDYGKITEFHKDLAKPMEDITTSTGLLYQHKENPFAEFEREILQPHMLSTEGPAMAIADVNGDGLEDVFIGSSKTNKKAIFVQRAEGKFFRLLEPALEKDSMYEDVDACWADINHDGIPDLVVASGGNEYFGNDQHLQPRIYINDGHGNLSILENAFPNIFVNASCIVPYDFNGDGNTDLFIGGRSVPGKYGEIPRSYLLQNDGHGIFTDVTAGIAKDLSKVGLVTGAKWVDIDKDNDKDLILCLEWGGVLAFINEKGNFTRKVLTDKMGWWNFLLPVDIDNDGDIDLVVGNLGLNSRLKASEQEPVRLYYSDFDENGKKEQILTYYVNGKEIPFANKEELEKQMPAIKKEFLYAEDFAKARLNDLFGKEKLEKADRFTANYFDNAILINKGNLEFTVKPMPWEAQFSPFRDAVVVNANNDSLPDILLVGNFFENNSQMGRYDADFGTLLINRGGDEFSAETIHGTELKGQSRHIGKIMINGVESYVIARNNDSTRIIRFVPDKKVTSR
jgi:hypothetical protein